MRIQVLSDLHIEFARFDVPTTDADVVVLAGDIGVGMDGIELALDTARDGDRDVIYVAGNHEYYKHAMPQLTDEMRAAVVGTRVRFLECDAAVIGGTRFVGCSLWTDFALLGDVQAGMDEARMFMSDYRVIRYGDQLRRLTPEDTVREHRASRAWLEQTVAEPFDGPTVVITHHAPSVQSGEDRHRSNRLAPAFASDLEPLIGASPRIDLWIHGHTHYCVDYTIGRTRVVSNQRGYPGEQVARFDPAFTVEI